MVLSKDDRKPKILIVEDDAHLAEGLSFNLTHSGYRVELAGSGTAALTAYRDNQPDLIVLDIMLPGMDGFSVLRHIRLQDERIPVLILSAKSGVDDKIRGLTYGVDDYLSKPFNLREFLLRVERLLERASWARGQAGEPPKEETRVEFGGNVVDLTAYTADCRQGEISLSEQEVKLLKIFFANPGRPLSRKELLEVAWGVAGETTTRTVDNFLVRFRKYFEENPKKPKLFKSVRSVGYVFVKNGDTPD